jgi:anti-sigma B factor antagonist
VSTNHLDHEQDGGRRDIPVPGSGNDAGTSGTDLTIRTRVVAERAVLSIEGELDLYSAPTLRDTVLATADAGHGWLIIDLTEVPFMDSSGLGVIVGCLKRLRESGGELTLVSRPGSPPSKLLSLTGLDRAIPTFASTDEALS